MFWGSVPLRFADDSDDVICCYFNSFMKSLSIPSFFLYIHSCFLSKYFFHTIRHVSNVNLHKTGYFLSNETSALMLTKRSKCQQYILTGNRISCYTSCNKDSSKAGMEKQLLSVLPGLIMNNLIKL